MKFGEYLRQRRDTKGWSQPAAAEHIGIEQSYLSKLETGKSYPSDVMFNKLQSAYGFGTDEIAHLMASDELQKLQEVKSVRIAILSQSQNSLFRLRKWTFAGLAGLMLGGACLGAAVVPDSAERQYQYRSQGTLKQDEALTAYQSIRSPDDVRYSEMLSRIDQRDRTLDAYRGESFVENGQDGRRYYELIGEVEINSHASLRFFIIPALMLLFGSLGCFWIAFLGRSKS